MILKLWNIYMLFLLLEIDQISLLFWNLLNFKTCWNHVRKCHWSKQSFWTTVLDIGIITKYQEGIIVKAFSFSNLLLELVSIMQILFQCELCLKVVAEITDLSSSLIKEKCFQYYSHFSEMTLINLIFFVGDRKSVV